MAKYRFRLETLQKIREARREQQRASLAESYRAEQILDENRQQLAREQAELRDVQRTATDGKYLDVNRVLEIQRYELLLRSQEQELEKQAVLLAAESERRRQVLVEAERDVRVLEILDTRHRETHRRDAERAETKQLDEIATNRWRSSGGLN